MNCTTCLLAGGLLGLAAAGQVSFAAEPEPQAAAAAAAPNQPPMAWWRFDDDPADKCLDASGGGWDAVADAGRTGRREPVEGMFGRALNLSGSHLLRVAGGPEFKNCRRVSFSVWVLPAAFDRYNEIFRKEDGEQRVLFSFQEHGTALSLGLNAGGYAECDAAVDPAELLDGQWHHCAATFDGERMRVYLDGHRIGELARPGMLSAGGPAPGCVGSADGGECFQGALDDLRIYPEALTELEVAALFASGKPALDRQARELEQRLAGAYVPGASLAETLAGCRAQLLKQTQAGPGVAGLLVSRIRQRHPDELREFTRVTRVNPADYLQARRVEFNVAAAERLLELMLEYRPLTPDQAGRETAEQKAQWEAAGVLERRFAALRAQGEAGQASPDWVTLLYEIGRRVQLRPYIQEAVAPYVRPETPPTVTLGAGEARGVLERDWLHQAGGRPAPERIRAEIGWARELAARVAGLAKASGKVDFSAELAELEALEGQAKALAGPDERLYFKVRDVKRRIALGNPMVDFSQVLFLDSPFPQGSEWQHETRHRLGYMAVPGGRLLVLEGLSPAGRVRQLLPQAPLHGSFWRPDLSYDARRVLACFKPHNEKSFHLYEVGLEGGGVRQLTDGPYDDLDPIYLPDERHVVFSTTRGNTYVRCMPPTSAFVLARCDLSGGNMYFISANNEPDYLPSVMGDGRIVYTRWEYTDKPLWRAQKLWTVNPDGTQVSMLWGNQSVWPDLVKDARSIPGTRKVMFTGSAHHDWFAGSVGIVDVDAGLNFPFGLTKVTADVPWPECGNGPVDPVESARYHSSGQYGAYYSPYPLGAGDFLVSANRNGKFVLYLMDVDGNRELIYEGVHHILHALPVRPRARPSVVPDRVAWPVAGEPNAAGEGTLFSANVYQGAPAALQGRAKYLRVLSIDHKTYTYWHQRPYISTGPVVSGVQSDGVKRVLGTVPVEPDGSVSFRVPAGAPLHFQLLDENQRALQTMRSFANVMPGESRGCVGCHELHSTSPVNRARGLALARSPSRIEPPPFADLTVSYPRYVRPVLDRYCGECHTGDGKGRRKLDLTARAGFLDFDETYWLLTGRPSWGQPYQPPADPPPGWGIADTLLVEGYSTTDPQAYRTPEPMTALSYKSRLIDLASSGKHHDVRVDPVSLQRLILWVDAMCPYRGEEEIRAIPDPEFQGVDWLAVRPRIKTAVQIARPGPLN